MKNLIFASLFLGCTALRVSTRTMAGCAACDAAAAELNPSVARPAWAFINPEIGFCYLAPLTQSGYSDLLKCTIGQPKNKNLGPEGFRGLPWISVPGTPDCIALGFPTRCAVSDELNQDSNAYVNDVGCDWLGNPKDVVEHTVEFLGFLDKNPTCDNGKAGKICKHKDFKEVCSHYPGH